MREVLAAAAKKFAGVATKHGLRVATASALMTVPIHGATDNWAVAVAVAASFAALVAAGTFLSLVRAGLSERRGPNEPRARRIGWGSWFLLLSALALMVFAMFEVLDFSQPAADRKGAGYTALVCVILIVLTGTGLVTRVNRLVWRSLPPRGGSARQWVIGFLIVGTTFLLFAGAGDISVSGLRAHGVKALATVTDVTGGRTETYFFRFTLPSGRVVHCSTENVLHKHVDDTQIEILYDSTDPSTSCQSADYGTGYGEVYIFGGGGAAVLAAGIIVWFLYRRRADEDVEGGSHRSEVVTDPVLP